MLLIKGNVSETELYKREREREIEKERSETIKKRGIKKHFIAFHLMPVVRDTKR